MNVVDKTKNGATKSFEIYVEKLYTGLGHMNRVMYAISGGTMEAYVNTLQGMMLRHQ